MLKMRAMPHWRETWPKKYLGRVFTALSTQDAKMTTTKPINQCEEPVNMCFGNGGKKHVHDHNSIMASTIVIDPYALNLLLCFF